MEGDHLSARREGSGTKGAMGPGKATPALPSHPPPRRCPEGPSVPFGCPDPLLFLQLPVITQGKPGEAQTQESPCDTRSGVWCPQGCLHGARLAGDGFLAQAPAATSLVLASPTDPAWLWSLYLPSGPVLLDKLCVHLERMHGRPWSDMNPCVSETAVRDIPWAPRARQVLSHCYYFPLNHLGEACGLG